MRKGIFLLLVMFFILYNLQSQTLESKLDSSINKSVSNFQSKNGVIEPFYLNIFLYYFEKKYDLDFNLNITSIKEQLSKTDIHQDSGPLYARLIGNSAININSKIIDSLYQPYDSIMLRALYHDQLNTKNAFFKKLLKKRYKDPDPYSISHTLFALAWWNELQPKNKLAIKNIDKFTSKGIQMLNNNVCIDLDRYVELATIITYHQKGITYHQEWAKYIIQLQNQHGSWGLDMHTPSIENEHCSILALWFLLQYQSYHINKSYDWIKLTK